VASRYYLVTTPVDGEKVIAKPTPAREVVQKAAQLDIAEGAREDPSGPETPTCDPLQAPVA
jgi:hypothetical protein